MGKFEIADVTIGWVRNSLELGTLALTENLLPQIKRNPLLEVVGPAREFDFDEAGNLAGLPEEIGKPVPAH